MEGLLVSNPGLSAVATLEPSGFDQGVSEFSVWPSLRGAAWRGRQEGRSQVYISSDDMLDLGVGLTDHVPIVRLQGTRNSTRRNVEASIFFGGGVHHTLSRLGVSPQAGLYESKGLRLKKPAC